MAEVLLILLGALKLLAGFVLFAALVPFVLALVFVAGCGWLVRRLAR